MNACILQMYEKPNIKILMPGVRRKELIFLTEMKKRGIRRPGKRRILGFS